MLPAGLLLYRLEQGSEGYCLPLERAVCNCLKLAAASGGGMLVHRVSLLLVRTAQTHGDPILTAINPHHLSPPPIILSHHLKDRSHDRQHQLPCSQAAAEQLQPAWTCSAQDLRRSSCRSHASVAQGEHTCMHGVRSGVRSIHLSLYPCINRAFI